MHRNCKHNDCDSMCKKCKINYWDFMCFFDRTGF